MPSFASSIRLPSWLAHPLYASVSRLELTFNPSISIHRLRKYKFTLYGEGQYLVLLAIIALDLYVCEKPALGGKLFIVSAYITGLLIPFTSQFVLPATPIFAWLWNFWCSRYSIAALRPHIWVSVLPTLESALYGANISDILTRYTSSTLDILAWLPYGLIHFIFPFVTAALIWIFGPPGAVKFFAKVFGYINFIGVCIQILVPCTPPWYELVYGQTPALYTMHGSPGGLARIDKLFGNSAYTNTFTNAPMPFGAFPSLHAGCSTADALLLNHFFPKGRWAYVAYVLWLYWSTMYLTHHYLIDLVAGAGLAVSVFYFFLHEDAYIREYGASASAALKSGSSPSSDNSGQANGLLSQHSRNGSAYTFPGENGTLGDEEQGYRAGPMSAEDYELPTRGSAAGGEEVTTPRMGRAELGVAGAMQRTMSSSSASEEGGARPRTPRGR